LGRASRVKNGGRWPPKMRQSTERSPEKDCEYRPTATVAERRCLLEPLTGTQLSEGLGATMSATNLPGRDLKSLLRRAAPPT
jgi:hypothetical protein